MSAGNWFPFNYRDTSGWHDSGLPITAPSNESAKLLDAALTEIVFNDADPIFGDFVTTLSKMKSADPDFIMGNVVNMCYNVLGASLRKFSDFVKEIKDFVERCKHLKMSNWEKQHVKALSLLAEGHWLECAAIYEDIIVDHPKDMHALQMLFGIYLYTGKSDRLRNSFFGVVKHHTKADRFYGSIHGKICFGYEECGQYEAAEKAGRIGLDHTPNEIWTMHSMAHVREESLRPIEGLKFLEETENNWKPRTSLVQHMWWHKALFYIASNNHESALSIYDEKLYHGAKNENNIFHLSDATSFLMRMELEGASTGISLKDRWRELALLFEDHVEKTDGFLFYDIHTLLACMYGDKPTWSNRVIDLVTATSDDDYENLGWNAEINRRLGPSILQGLKAFHYEDYDSAVSYLKPIRYDMIDQLGGSHAQKDILNQVLVWSAIKSGNRRLSEHLLEERMAAKSLMVPDHTNLLHKRMEANISGI